MFTAPDTASLLNKHFLSDDIGIQHLQTDRLATFYLNLSRSFFFLVKVENSPISYLLNKPQAFTNTMGYARKVKLAQELLYKSLVI